MARTVTKTFVYCLGVAALVAILVSGPSLYESFREKAVLERRSGKQGLPSCWNHATFVARALGRHVGDHGALPYEAGLRGDVLLCRVDMQGPGGANCHSGAPGQLHGGWQMLNGSPVDVRLLESRLDRFPVVWCGRSHDGKRVVVYWTVAEISRARIPFDYQMILATSILTVSDEVLATEIDSINRVLVPLGRPEVEIDIRGRLEYWDIARRYQTEEP